MALNTLLVGRFVLGCFGGGALILFSANFTLPVFVLDGRGTKTPLKRKCASASRQIPGSFASFLVIFGAHSKKVNENTYVNISSISVLHTNIGIFP